MKVGYRVFIKFFFGFFCGFVCSEAKTIKICDLNPGIYSKEILPKIESGIPFELMVILLMNDQMIERKMIHISNNLWDEIITIKSDQKTFRQFPLSQGFNQICNFLSMDTPAKLVPHSRVKVRLLLNPMWPERLARLHLSTRADLENKKLIGIDWKKIAEEMPSEKVLLEKELD